LEGKFLSKKNAAYTCANAVITQKIMRCAGHAEHTGETRNAYKILALKVKGTKNLGYLGKDGRTNLRELRCESDN
jgi:hypothetical protein